MKKKCPKDEYCNPSPLWIVVGVFSILCSLATIVTILQLANIVEVGIGRALENRVADVIYEE